MSGLETNVRAGLNCPPVPVDSALVGLVARERLRKAAGTAAVWQSMSRDQRLDIHRTNRPLARVLEELAWVVEDGDRQITRASREPGDGAAAEVPRAS